MRTLLTEIIAGLVVNLISLSLFFEVSRGVLGRQTGIFDAGLAHFIQSFRTPFLTEIMKTITIFGGPGILVGTLSVAFILSVHRHNRRSLIFLTLIITGVALNFILKFMFHRVRPEGGLIDEYFYSFPSGHAMNAFIFYMAIAYMFYHYTQDRILGTAVAVGMSFWVFLIGLSRIYLGVHYPSDVIAGYFGGLWLLVSFLVAEKVLKVEHLITTRKE